MASTITNYSENIDTAFPVPGVDNDTQGFRNNFSNIRDGLVAASTEIEDIQLIQTGLITQLNSITTPENIATSGIIVTNLTATNVTADGIVRASSFIGDGSQLTGISIGTALASLSVSGSLTAGNTNILGRVTATNATINGTVQAAQFIGDGSQLTGIAATYTNLSSLATLALPSTDVSAKSLVASGEIRGQFFVGDGSQLTNLSYPSQELLSRLTVTGNSALGGSLTISGTITSSGTITAKSLSLSDTLSVTTATASYFVGDGSGLTNVGLSSAYSQTPIISVNTKNITISNEAATEKASMFITSSTLIVTDISQVVVLSTATTTRVLDSYTSVSSNGFVSTLTFTTALTNISNASTDFNVFKLWPGDPILHPVLSKSGLSITTTAFDFNPAEAAGVGPTDTVTFYRTNAPRVALYVNAIPSSAKGQAGDKKGMMIATSQYIYMCFQDYTDGIADIWLRSALGSNTIP
jgi:hypothetical protein